MPEVQGPRIELAPFTFRIEAAEVDRYRAALGAPGGRVPLGMALRALTSERVLSALGDLAAGFHPIHIAQDYRAEGPLQVGVDYSCVVLLERRGESRLRIEQHIVEPSGRKCLVLASDIALVAP